MFSRLLDTIANQLISIGEKIKQKPADRVQHTAQSIEYLPPKPVGEIRPRKHQGTTAYFWLYDEDGKRKYKYLSRDKKLAEEKREELSGFLNQPD